MLTFRAVDLQTEITGDRRPRQDVVSMASLLDSHAVRRGCFAFWRRLSTTAETARMLELIMMRTKLGGEREAACTFNWGHVCYGHRFQDVVLKGPDAKPQALHQKLYR